jgi:hypothetical protein
MFQYQIFSDGMQIVFWWIVIAVDPKYNQTPVFDENNIRTYEYPFGDMVRELLDMQSPNSPSP